MPFDPLYCTQVSCSSFFLIGCSASGAGRIARRTSEAGFRADHRTADKLLDIALEWIGSCGQTQQLRPPQMGRL